MHENLSRGKRTDNREWIVGWYIRYGYAGNEKSYIVPSHASALYAIEVDPNTVGQFTGLLDNNGKRIFEGDIIKIRDVYGYRNGKTIIDYRICDVRYSFGAMRLCCSMQLLSSFNKKCEVIGNIHDNPQL